MQFLNKFFDNVKTRFNTLVGRTEPVGCCKIHVGGAVQTFSRITERRCNQKGEEHGADFVEFRENVDCD